MGREVNGRVLKKKKSQMVGNCGVYKGPLDSGAGEHNPPISISSPVAMEEGLPLTV